MTNRFAGMFALWLLIFPLPAVAICIACSCSVAVNSNVAFGIYNPLPGTVADAVGSITTTCDVTLGLLSTYTVALSQGNSGSYSPRKMSSGGNTLNYNLYIDSARTSVWGDGTGGSVIVSDATLLGLLGHFVRPYNIYGRILASQQGTHPGNYTDSIMVIVTYN